MVGGVNVSITKEKFDNYSDVVERELLFVKELVNNFMVSGKHLESRCKIRNHEAKSMCYYLRSLGFPIYTMRTSVGRGGFITYYYLDRTKAKEGGEDASE